MDQVKEHTTTQLRALLAGLRTEEIRQIMTVMQYFKLFLQRLLGRYAPIEYIIHFDPTNDNVRVVYTYNIFRWTPYIDVPSHGWFMFKVWDTRHSAYECIILRDWHVCKALNIDDPSKLWKISRRRLAALLCDYIRETVHQGSHRILDININGNDEYMRLYPLLRSFYIPCNVTMHIIDMVYSWLTDEACHTKHDIMVTNFDYKPYYREYDDFLFSS